MSFVSRTAGFTMRVASPVALVALVALAACGEDVSIPSAFAATGALTRRAAVAATVGAEPIVRVTDAKGRAIRGVLVRWRVTSGGGRIVNDSIRTSSTGDAPSGGWTLGTVAGVQTLEADADGLPAVIFTAQADPGPPARLIGQNWTEQRAEVNTDLTTMPSVRVEDFFGNPVPDVAVTFDVLLGGGSATDRERKTDAGGVARVGGWKLGTTSGEQILRAASPQLLDVSFRAVADPGPVSKFIVAAPSTQEGAPRAPTPASPAVRTTDVYGNAVGGVLVSFIPGAGSGTVSASTTASDPVSGLASVTWTLSSAPQQTLTVMSAAAGASTATFTATTIDSDFDIDVRFVGTGGTARQRDAFAKAVVRWRRVLTERLHQTRLNAPAGECASWIPRLDESARDVVIFARLAMIDGPGRILGQAGPCYINESTNLTAVGLMEFDLDDLPSLINNGTLDPVVLHEIGHVLGIGTLWSFRRTLLAGRGTDDPTFNGASARAQFLASGGLAYAGMPIPVENTGGQGTRDSHWRRTVFGRELMQGFSSPGAVPPMSATTVASLLDLGYPSVRLSAADPFSFFAAAFFESPAAPVVDLAGDVANIPLIGIDRNGNRRVLRPRLP
ncbi:MAG TPA: leishmanolysin-related zinc metalloendopeptidase [Gemmatimonas sp.]|nr:leishmanolysin-related zinc metalloendopeptidase [Gemmatimonas sp.]